jgi:hypothetical protein
MRRLMIAGVLVILAVSGCASTQATSTGAKPEAAPVETPPVSGSQSIPAPPAASPSAPGSSANKGSDQSSAPLKPLEAAPPLPPAPRPVNAATSSSPAKVKSPTVARPVKHAGAAAAQLQPPAMQATTSDKPPIPSAAPTPPPASSPTLNLTDLEQRLRETRAIGVFTKLSLKNQVDDLLGAFRALYRGPNKRPPAELRQRYDLLLLKVLTLLQDSDPSLAAAIQSSREAIWGILADPDKFAKI